MINDDFRISSKLYESSGLILCRAIKKNNGNPVILKQIKDEHPYMDRFSLCKRELEATKNLQHEGILKIWGIAENHRAPVLVMEDFEGNVLANILANGKISIQLFLKTALRLADILGFIHSAKMSHFQIQPENVLIDPDSAAVKLTGFNPYTGIPVHQQLPSFISKFKVAYISPEQTGRVVQEVDYRADFYSLGVIFYQMLTGVLPFRSDDYMEIIYSHLAREAVPIHELNKEAPRVLSDIVGKLMQKEAEERYQTAAGLKRDLEECRQRLACQSGIFKIAPFTPGRYDAPVKLQLPQGVFGRDEELKRLVTCFDQVREGKPGIVFIAGYPGVGKTTLVREMYAPVKNAGGLFTYGKFDQYKNNTPYASLIQAFDLLFRKILAWDKDSITAWKDRITGALGNNAGVITNVFPRLEKITGPQEPVENLPVNEAQYRLNRVLISFLQAVATKENPLVIFLDDLQWADNSSIQLLDLILSGVEKMHVLFIGAYRDNEVTPLHQLYPLLEKTPGTGVVEIINLKPLAPEHVRRIVSEMLYNSDQTEMLAKLCSEKTGGNPFFLLQFIKSLQDDGLINFNRQERKWEVELDQITHRNVTDNVVDLVVREIAGLPQRTTEILKLAACINNTFEVETLAAILGVSRQSAAEALMVAVRRGLVVSQDVSHSYRFLHDRVQQAAYILASKEQRIDFHYRIGKLLLEKHFEWEKAENLLEITDHLNLAESIVTARNESLLLARLNLEAGTKVKGYSAYQRALDYLSRGIGLVGNNGWDNCYEITLSLYTQATEMAYICTQYQPMEQFGNTVLDKGKTLLDQAKIYEIKIEYLTVQNRLEEAIETGRHVLKRFGIKIPRRPTRLNIMLMYFKTRLALAGRTFDDLRKMPEMQDPKHLTMMRIIISTGSAAYSYSEPVVVMLMLNLVLMSIKHGIAPVTPVSYVVYGHILCAYIKKRELGYKFGKLAIELQAGMESKAFACKTNMLFEILLRHQREHIGNTLNGFPYNHQQGLNTGDLNSAGHVMMQHFTYLYLAGRELLSIQRDIEQYRYDLLKTGNQTSINVCMMYLQGIVNLQGATGEPWKLTGQYFNEKETLTHYKSANDRTIIFNSYFNKMIISYLFGQYNEALNNLKIVEEYLDGAMGFYCIPVYNFYSVLIRLELLGGFSGRVRSRHKKKMLACLREIKGFYMDAPENNTNKYFLVLAEQARAAGNHNQAMEYYDKSIKAAGENGFLPEEALANEMAAKYYYSTGKIIIAENYARNAAYCYTKWGCELKAKQLREQYPNLRQEMASSRDISPGELDLNTIVKASQALSEEIVLQELLKKMIYIVLQNAGARKVLFVMEKEGKLYIAATGSADSDQVKVMKGEAVKGNSSVSEKLLNYVANTGEYLLLNSRSDIETFIDEQSVQNNDAKSLLCFPVESKRSLAGLLYLENDLMDGAFTGRHLLVLKVLSSQLAISLENARLYQNMERMVEERTEQLKTKNYELECANMELENANRAKTEFLANVSHEMRTPLHGVLGMANLLLKADFGPEQKENIDSIINSARSLLEIINAILDFSKIESNMMILEKCNFDIDQLIKEILPAFVLKAEEKGLKLFSTIHRESTHCFYGDPLKIKQVITNLLSNAIKFTEQGKVELLVSVVKSGNNKYIMEVSVIDSGIGIPRDKFDYIYQDFTQVDSSTTKKYGGTGLGLSITKKLVRLMNGTITVDSSPGQGSTFKCMLPLQTANSSQNTFSANGQDKLKHNKQDLAPLRILVAEDNLISGKYIKALLEYLNCNVTLVINGMEVLETLKTGNYDCIIMDKNMPEMDGIETTRIIRKDEEGTGKHIPIIALTASAIKGDKEKLLAQGMDYYLSKPINETELVEILKDVKDRMTSKTLPGNNVIANKEKFINRQVYLEEASLFGEEVFLEIISDFMAEYQQALQSIENQILNNDCTGAYGNIHRFAGTLATFHCSGLVDEVKALERKAAEKDIEGLLNLLPVFKDNIQAFLTECEDIKSILVKRTVNRNNTPG